MDADESIVERARPPKKHVASAQVAADGGARQASSAPSTLGPWEEPAPGGASGDASVAVPVTNAEHVVRGMAGAVSRCYKQALARNEWQVGRLSVVIKVGPLGAVNHVQATNHGNFDDAMVGCVLKVVYSSQFAPDPVRGIATISTSFSFKRD